MNNAAVSEDLGWLRASEVMLEVDNDRADARLRRFLALIKVLFTLVFTLVLSLMCAYQSTPTHQTRAARTNYR